MSGEGKEIVRCALAKKYEECGWLSHKEDLTQPNQLGTQILFSEKIIMSPQREGLFRAPGKLTF